MDVIDCIKANVKLLIASLQNLTSCCSYRSDSSLDVNDVPLGSVAPEHCQLRAVELFSGLQGSLALLQEETFRLGVTFDALQLLL